MFRCSVLPAETVLALNRNPDYWVYGKGEMQSKRGLDAGEDLFNKVSMEERSKFKEETLSNVGGRTSASRMRRYFPNASIQSCHAGCCGLVH